MKRQQEVLVFGCGSLGEEVARQLNVQWGVDPVKVRQFDSLEAMIKAGAFDGFGQSRQGLLQQLNRYVHVEIVHVVALL